MLPRPRRAPRGRTGRPVLALVGRLVAVSGPAVRRSLADSTRRLLFLGGPLPLRLAVSSYRAAGSGGYSMLRGARVVWRSGREVRDLMVEYFSERGRLPASADGNWRLVPPRAVETLAREEAAAR